MITFSRKFIWVLRKIHFESQLDHFNDVFGFESSLIPIINRGKRGKDFGHVKLRVNDARNPGVRPYGRGSIHAGALSRGTRTFLYEHTNTVLSSGWVKLLGT